MTGNVLELNIEAISRNHWCRGRAVVITHPGCVSVALVIQRTKRMRLVILSSVACLAVPYFSHYLKNATIFGGKNFVEHRISVLIFCTAFVRNIPHSKNN